MPMRRTFLASSLGVSFVGLAVACGGINDPTIGKTPSAKVATISGALTGTGAPTGAHVALVWRTGKDGGYAVGADAPVVDGKFTLVLETPPDGYFMDETGSSATVSAPGESSPPSAGTSGSTGSSGTGGPTVTDDGGTAGSSGGSTSGSGSSSGTGGRSLIPKITPSDTAGGQIAPAFTVAVAGFVVWSDANGNGVLDLSGATVASPDKLLGGNSELFIADLRGGGALDYEKLRDKSGILPTEGFNLVWTQGRWLPLNEVELKLTTSIPKLASPVCGGSSSATPSTVGNSGGTIGGGSSGGSSSGSTGNGAYGSWFGPFPSPTDPLLRCSPDGRSWTYDRCPTPPPPPPEGLCSSGVTFDEPCASDFESLVVGANPPADWPCPTAITGSDAGAPSDAAAD